MVVQELIEKHFVQAHSEVDYLISRNSKFILDFNKDGTMSLKPNTENLNNKKIKKYWDLDRNEFGGDFHSLSEENFKNLIYNIYEI